MCGFTYPLPETEEREEYELGICTDPETGMTEEVWCKVRRDRDHDRFYDQAPC